MEEKHESKRKEGPPGSKITNYFPSLRAEGRAKMCAGKTDDSRQKEMLKKIKSDESLNLRSKRVTRTATSEAAPSTPKEKKQNVPNSSLLKTPLGQALRKSMESGEKKETLTRSSQKAVGKKEVKKEAPEVEGVRVTRQKALESEKSRRSSTRGSESSDKPKVASSENSRARTTHKLNTQALDAMLEEAKSKNSDDSQQKKPKRKRKFRGGTYGLYLTKSRRKKMKLRSKDDECSVTSTENNSLLDSEDGNSRISEDFCSEKSLADEEPGATSSESSPAIKIEKMADDPEAVPGDQEKIAPKPEPVDADYEENTQNVTDESQNPEEMQWESNTSETPAEEVCVDNQTVSDKVSEMDSKNGEDASKALQFSFKDLPHEDDSDLSKACKESDSVDQKKQDHLDSKKLVSAALDGGNLSNDAVTHGGSSIEISEKQHGAKSDPVEGEAVVDESIHEGGKVATDHPLQSDTSEMEEVSTNIDVSESCKDGITPGDSKDADCGDPEEPAAQSVSSMKDVSEIQKCLEHLEQISDPCSASNSQNDNDSLEAKVNADFWGKSVESVDVDEVERSSCLDLNEEAKCVNESRKKDELSQDAKDSLALGQVKGNSGILEDPKDNLEPAADSEGPCSEMEIGNGIEQEDPLLNDAGDQEIGEALETVEDQSNDVHSEAYMEVGDATEKPDGVEDLDSESTIATCVKSRQRIKRKFTDDIVDTDLGVISAATMSTAKKVSVKHDTGAKDAVESFQNISAASEARRSGTVPKIECIFNMNIPPVKQCYCESDMYPANLENTEEDSFCHAVDSIDDKLLGCTNPVVTNQLVRASGKIPFSLMCEMHLWRLRHHHSCPYCGLFCSQGSFIQCKGEGSKKVIHLFHEQCQPKEEGLVNFCLHCGNTTNLKRVHLEMHMASPPSFFLSQNTSLSLPDVSKARITFPDNSDSALKDEEEHTHVFKIEDSGKVLSSAGLPNGTSKEELEKLIGVLSDEKVRSYSFASDEFYEMAAGGNILKVLYMLAKGQDPNISFPNHENETALHAAAAAGHIAIVHLLIQAGAMYEALNDRMYTPLMLAVENGHKDVAHYLVKKGALTDFKGDNGMSGLHLAAKGGNLEILKILMTSRDADINSLDDGGWTPIVWASEHDHLSVVRYLLKRGANPNIRDNEGNIGLHWSAFSGSVEISYLYLDYGCDINAVNELGDTPLHIAARQDSFPCVTLFLSRGADVQILNKANKLPAECCIDKNSDTYLSLSLNLLVKKITGKYQHKAEKILHRDISRGKEQLAIQCVNSVDDEPPPVDFLYVTENCETMPIKIDRTITSLQSCHCDDDCSSSSCSCASISYQCWYDKESLLVPEFNLLDPPMLFECNRACSCWSLNCHNRVLQNGITCRLQLIRTKGKGWGVRTLKDIPKGAFICEYVGELISDSAADKRADDSYLFDLDNRDGETYCLDARYYGNVSRFINHLCEPNLVPVKVYVDHQDLNFPRIAFFSSRDIKQYEELGFDYGEKFWAIKYKYFTCDCGTPKCKYSKDTIHITLANYYRRLNEEQMEEAAVQQQQQQQNEQEQVEQQNQQEEQPQEKPAASPPQEQPEVVQTE